MIVDISCKSGDLWGNDVTLLFALLTTIHLAFSENFVDFSFGQIFSTSCFTYGNNETLTSYVSLKFFLSKDYVM